MDAGHGSTSAARDRLKVFVNYRRSDTEGYAGRVYEALRRPIGAANMVMDVDSMKPGQDFVRALDEAVAGCDVLLAMIGPNWLDAAEPDGSRRLDDPLDHVRVEIVSALSRDKIVIPLLFSGARMPGAGVMPDALEPLRTRNALVVRHERFRGDIAELVKELRRLQSLKDGAAGATAAAAATTATTPATAPPTQMGTVGLVKPEPVLPVIATPPRRVAARPWSSRPLAGAAALGFAAVAILAVVVGGGLILGSGAAASPTPASSAAVLVSAPAGSGPTPTPSSAPTLTPSPTPSAAPTPSASAVNPSASVPAGSEDARYTSPDGRLVGIVHLEPNGYFECYVERADGTGRVNVSNHPDQDLFLSWSPDSARIVFISHRDLNDEVYTVNPDGSDLARLTNTSVDESWPAYSPDGSLILFLRHAQDYSQADIWVMSSTGADQRAVMKTPEDEGLPSWTPDGRIQFTRFFDSGNKDYVVRVDGKGLMQVP